METTWHSRMRSLAPVPLRLVLGFGFIIHGYPKLFTAGGAQDFAGMLAGIGVPAPGLAGYLIGAFEFFGGILLILGVGVRVISMLGVVEMAVAGVTIHWPAGFNFLNVTGTTETGGMEFGIPGYEVSLLYIAGFLSLLISGSGTLSLPSIQLRKVERAAPEARMESDGTAYGGRATEETEAEVGARR